MGTRTGQRKPIRIGRFTSAAVVAGIAGVAITVVATAGMVVGAVSGGSGPGLAPGYEDYGLRHRFDATIEGDVSPSQLDDYGIRCMVVGWCNMPPGVPQPTRG